MIDYTKKTVVDGDPEKLGTWHKGVLKVMSFKHKKVLDIGCGSGSFLLHLKDVTSEVAGVDPNKENCEVVRRHGIEVFNDYPENLPKEYYAKFDIATNFEVIEHTYTHKEIVKTMSDVLVTSGVGVITTPNAFNIMRRIKFLFLEEHHDSLMDPTRSDSPEHLRLWSYPMMKRLCDNIPGIAVNKVLGISSVGGRVFVLRNRFLVGFLAQHLVAILKKK